MDLQLFHIFRNTPLGRETFLQSLYFCNTVGASPLIYVPEHTKFLMYFENDVVQVDLDGSYLTAPETAIEHVNQLAENAGLKPRYIRPKNFTATTLPDIPTNFDFMCSPRSISDLSSKIGLGYIGPRVRRIVKSARFPVLITSPVYKPWTSITVFFGGSANSINALRLGCRICRATGMELNLFTQAENRRTRDDYRAVIDKSGMSADVDRYVSRWDLFEKGTFEENLYEMPHDALAVVGAYGHNLIKAMVFGSKMETIQSTVSNNFLVVGPSYTALR